MSKKYRIIHLMKRVTYTIILFVMYMLCSADESICYYENWRAYPFPYTMGPFYRNYSYGPYLPLYCYASDDFDPSKPYLNLTYSYSYCGYDNPWDNTWWNSYSFYMNIFPKKYLDTPDIPNSLSLVGSAPLILKENEPESPMNHILNNFFNITNRNDKVYTTNSDN
jgi:hypothetical protein